MRASPTSSQRYEEMDSRRDDSVRGQDRDRDRDRDRSRDRNRDRDRDRGDDLKSDRHDERGDRRHDSKREHRHKSGHKHKKHRKHKKRSHKSDRSEKGSDSDGDASDDGSPATGTKRSTRSPDGDAPDEPKRMKMSNGDSEGDDDAGSEVAGKGDGKGDDDEIDELVRRKALIERELQRERDIASKEPKESKPEDPEEQQDSEEATSPNDNVVETEERTETKDEDKEPKQSKAKDKERTETKTKDKEPNKSQVKDKEPNESKAKDKDKAPKKPDASSPSRKSTHGGSRRRSRSPRRRRSRSRSRSRSPPRRRRSRSRSRSRSPPRRRWSRSPPRRRRSRSPPRRRSRSPPRRRSRSPQRGSRRDDRRDRPALSRHNDTRNGTGRDRSSGKAGVPPPPSGRPPSQNAAADDEDDSDIEIEDEDEEAVEAASIEAARKKREEIMAKFKSSAANTPKTPADSAGQGSAIVVPDPVPESGPPSLPGVSPDLGSPRLAVTPDNLSPVDLPSSLANKVEEELSMFGDKFDIEASAAASGGNAGAINDQCDDAEGYFKIVAGELLDKRYKVSGKSGAGVFSNVVRAIDTLVEGRASKVAIKIIRNNDLMYKAALKELEIIRKLNSVDKDDSHHVVKLKRHFMHKKHLCLVFPNAAMNLRELTKKYGRDGAEVVGLSLTATKAYAKQLLMSLKLLKKTHILHADIKPDNILVNEAKTTVTLCDLGAALDVKEMEVTEYMESRFYRAPEIILGQGFGYGMDMWALGCTLYELYTGKILFTGGNNNQMLKMHLNLKGKPSKQFLKKGSFWTKHFDFDMNFMHRELDTVTQKPKIRIIKNMPATTDLMGLLKRAQKLDEREMKKLVQFKDFLERMLEIDPERRITPKEALQHDFIKLPF